MLIIILVERFKKFLLNLLGNSIIKYLFFKNWGLDGIILSKFECVLFMLSLID